MKSELAGALLNLFGDFVADVIVLGLNQREGGNGAWIGVINGTKIRAVAAFGYRLHTVELVYPTQCFAADVVFQIPGRALRQAAVVNENRELPVL